MYQNIYYSRKDNVINLWDDQKGLVKFPYKKYAYIKANSGNQIALDGHKVKKVYRWDKDDESRNIMYESDVAPELRTLIDLYHDSDEPSNVYKVMYLDIEVDMTNQLPDINKAENKITSIAVYLKDLEEYYVFVLDEALIATSENLPANTKMIPCLSEDELLSEFLQFYCDYEPTIITGWNIDFFDIPYLYNRISNVMNKNQARKLSPIGVVERNSNTNVFTIAGVSCLDYLPLYKKFSINEEPSYTLDAISNKELKKGKIKYEGSLNDLFKNDIAKFIEYNINDVQLVKELDDKLKFIELTRSICHKGHVPYNAIFASSRYLEGAILTYMRNLDIIAPNKPINIIDEDALENADSDEDEDNEDEGKFAGAYVKPPKPGRYQWLTCIDATSLYPSNIMTCNISPETKIGKLTGWDKINMMSKFKKDLDHFDTSLILKHVGGKEQIFNNKEAVMEYLKETGNRIAGNGAIYDSKNKGLIPAILEKWFQERVDFKNLMKKAAKEKDKVKEEYFDRLQYTMKILLNSMYGVLGLQSFRFFDLDNAEAVTLTGQDVLQFADIMGNKWIQTNLVPTLHLEKYGIKAGTPDDFCIYSDTDSNYFLLSDFIDKKNGDEIEQVKKISAELTQFINDNLFKFTKVHLNSDYNKLVFKEEAVIKSGLWIKKKRYSYHKVFDLESNIPADKIVVKGLDVVRSNFPPLFRKFMNDILNDILKFESKESIDAKIVDLQEKISSFSILDLAKPTSAKNLDAWKCKGIQFKKGTPVHIKATLAYNFLLDLYKLNKTMPPIMSGSKVKWLYLKTNPFNLITIAFKGDGTDPKEVMQFIDKYIDHNKNFESNLLKKLQAFYNALNWQTIPRKNAAKINSFFEF